MIAAIRMGWKVLRFLIGLFTGDKPDTGSVLSGAVGGLIPKPLNSKAKAKAKALAVENKILRDAAERDDAAEIKTIKDDIEVKDEKGNITGFNF